MNVLSDTKLNVAIQGLQDILGAICEASPSLCPYVPSTMEAVFSVMEAIADIARLTQAALAGAGLDNLGPRNLSRLVRAAHTDLRTSVQPTTEDSSKVPPEDIIQWLQSKLDSLCRQKFPLWCQYVPHILDFMREILKDTEESCTTLSEAFQAILSGLNLPCQSASTTRTINNISPSTSSAKSIGLEMVKGL
ncbi:hypothetical protein ColTof3_07412 [Colletotrichum tofieldiae]|nr:hypothetical protein ColTof3_07412 [Colletotrichum tofieldiae]